jgi:hypothetical protein
MAIVNKNALKSVLLKTIIVVFSSDCDIFWVVLVSIINFGTDFLFHLLGIGQRKKPLFKLKEADGFGVVYFFVS